jgi:hypothetical protein
MQYTQHKYTDVETIEQERYYLLKLLEYIGVNNIWHLANIQKIENRFGEQDFSKVRFVE